jgi:hypothetical protein
VQLTGWMTEYCPPPHPSIVGLSPSWTCKFVFSKLSRVVMHVQNLCEDMYCCALLLLLLLVGSVVHLGCAVGTDRPGRTGRAVVWPALLLWHQTHPPTIVDALCGP